MTGKVKHTTGSKVGRDDGFISAQRGEYVIRKAAVQKLGTKVLDQINKGKLPKGISHAAGGQVSGLVPRSTKTDMWIDNIPVDRYDTANSADRKLSRKPPNADTDDDITTGPQPPRETAENSRGGKVKKVLRRVR